MATPAVDPIDAFFTPERLAYYRDLHARYPVWCGNWPHKEKTNWEYGFWSRSQRVNKILGVDAFHRAPLLPSITDRILLRAILECFRRSEDDEVYELADLNLPLIKEWSAGLKDTLEGHSADLTRKIFYLRDQILSPLGRPDLSALMRQLESCWVAVGREIGAIPKLQGGKVCNLSDPFLAQLKSQGQDLIATLVVFEPPSDQLVSVRKLFGSEADLLKPVQVERLASLDRQGRTKEADEERRDVYSCIDEEHGTVDLARHLAFPMLDATEIAHALGHTAGKLHQGRITKVVFDILADRLPIGRKTVVNRIRLGKKEQQAS